MIRFLSRDRSGAQRVTGTPPAVRTEPPAEEMPPRPQLRRPSAGGTWWHGAATVDNYDPAGDPCGAPPIATGKRARNRRAS